MCELAEAGLSRPTILVVAHSGRWLAQQVHALGLAVIVLDCFADLDTARYARRVLQVPELTPAFLQPLLEQLAQTEAIAGVLYGSGAAESVACLMCLAAYWPLLGNAPSVVEALADKPRFFALLSTLGVSYPAVQFTPPAAESGWLQKPRCGQGGQGIVPYRAGLQSCAPVYWQRYQAGVAQSVTFLVTNAAVQIIGFNTQWTTGDDEDTPFCFAGIINHAELVSAARQQLLVWVQQLARAFALTGINSLDFINTGQQYYVLEINPRPSASLQLYAATWLAQHLRVYGLLGQVTLPERPSPPVKYSAYQLVYAPQPTQIPAQLRWPRWCHDLPAAGAIIGTNQPICSIIAHHARVQQLQQILRARRRLLLSQLTSGV